MLKIALLSMIVIQVYSQTAHDKWKYCQILFENKNSKTSFETCDACFIPLAYYNSIGASLTRSRYRPKSLVIGTDVIIPPKQSCTYEAKVELVHGPDYILDYFIIDLNVISEDELARRVKEVNKKEPKPGGLILLLNGNQILLSKKEFDNSKVTNELVQLNLTFPVFIIRVRLFTGDVGWQLANFIQDNDTRNRHEANANVTLMASYQDDPVLFENWMHMIALCALALIQLSTTLIAYYLGSRDHKVRYFIQGKNKLPKHEHSGSSDCPMTIYVAKCGLWAVLLLLILFAILFIVTGYSIGVMYYVFYILFIGCLVVSTLLLWIRLINRFRVLRCNMSRWKRLVIVLIPGLLLGALFGTMHVVMKGHDYYILFHDLFNCIIIIAFLLHFEIMSFWSMILYGVGMMILEIILSLVFVSTGVDCPEKTQLYITLYRFAYQLPLISGPGVKIETGNETSYQMLSHAPIDPQNPFFLVIFHFHTFKLICQHPLKFSLSQWSIYVPSVMALYLCRFNERKSLKPSKLYVSLTLTIMVLGSVMDFIMDIWLFGGSIGLVFSVPLIMAYAVTAAALRKELRFLVLSKYDSDDIDPLSRTSGTYGIQSHGLRSHQVMPYYEPQSSSFLHTKGHTYEHRSGARITTIVPGRKSDIIQRGRSYSRSKRKRAKARPSSVPMHFSYRPGTAIAVDDTADITLDVVRRRTEPRPFCLSEFSITSLTRCLDMTYLTYY